MRDLQKNAIHIINPKQNHLLAEVLCEFSRTFEKYLSENLSDVAVFYCDEIMCFSNYFRWISERVKRSEFEKKNGIIKCD